MILYKYLSSKFLSAFLDHGEILFRNNLCYFRKIEGDTARGDKNEGMHLDVPDNLITITNVTTGQVHKMAAGMVRQVDFEKIFVFCLSTECSRTLMKEFAADTCVKIFDSDQFLERCRNSIRSITHLHGRGLLSGFVEYYVRSKSVSADITDPGQVAFLKSRKFSNQKEYRLAFGIMNSLQPNEGAKIILKHALEDELNRSLGNCRPRTRTVRIGRIRDFAEVEYLRS